MARFKAGDYEAARATLLAAIEAGNESGGACLYLGLAEEELQDWSAARTAYNRYLVVGQSAQVRAEVRNRLSSGSPLACVHALSRVRWASDVGRRRSFYPCRR